MYWDIHPSELLKKTIAVFLVWLFGCWLNGGRSKCLKIWFLEESGKCHKDYKLNFKKKHMHG